MNHILLIPKGIDARSDQEALLLAELLAATATTEERRRGHFISFRSRHLRELIGSRYKATIRSASAANRIDVNDIYSVGRFPKSYRLTKRYRRPKFRVYELRRSSEPKSRIRLAEDDHVGRALAEWLSQATLPHSLHLDDWTNFIVASRQANGDYAVRCAYGRLHTSLTGFPKLVRRELRLAGEPVVEIDVRNCQPLLVGLLASLPERAVNQRDTTTQAPGHTTTHPPLPYVAHYRDLADYLKLCCQGLLYEHLLSCCRDRGLLLYDTIPPEWRDRYGPDRPLERDDVKHQFIVAMFAKNWTAERMPLFGIVAEGFPAVARFMSEEKRHAHQRLACDCQRLESRLMIDGAAGDLVAAGVPAVTVHDSLIVRRGDEQLARDAIIRQFAPFGVTPAIGTA